MLAPTLHFPAADAEKLARSFLDGGPAFPFRLRLACLRVCGARLSVDGDLLAQALQWQSGGPAVLDASATFNAAVAQVMTA